MSPRNISDDGKTLSVNNYGINSYAGANTFPELSAKKSWSGRVDSLGLILMLLTVIRATDATYYRPKFPALELGILRYL
jgi:hypothetical protein